MNNIMKTFFIVLCAMTATMFASCSNGDQGSQDEPKECIKKINNYLYAMEYEDYDFVDGVKWYEEKFGIAAPGCSEVRKGNFVGRNLDWNINTDLAAIIRVDRKGNPDTDDFFTSRYASIGMVATAPSFGIDKITNTTDYHPIYERLPFTTSDGINENGVYVGVNVTATGETSMDRSKWNHDRWGVGAANTNPLSDKRFCVSYLTRVILDHAKSVEDAISIVKSISWYEPVNFPKEGATQAFHWFIADKTTNCVLEFVDNEPVVVKTNDVRNPSLATIMTNFNNYLWDKGIIQDHGMGYERYDLLADNYFLIDETAEDMEQLMEKVWYTKAYTMKFDEPYYWATDHVTDFFTAEKVYKHPEVLKDERFRESVEKECAIFNDRSKWHTPKCEAWYTTHTSVYDIEHKTLRVKLHEGLDGMQDYYPATIDDKFPNPLANKPKK